MVNDCLFKSSLAKPSFRRLKKGSFTLDSTGCIYKIPAFKAGIAQLVERNLAKVEVGSSSLLSRSKFRNLGAVNRLTGVFLYWAVLRLGSIAVTIYGELAKRLCTGLQIHVARFDSGTRLHFSSICLNNHQKIHSFK